MDQLKLCACIAITHMLMQASRDQHTNNHERKVARSIGDELRKLRGDLLRDIDTSQVEDYPLSLAFVRSPNTWFSEEVSRVEKEKEGEEKKV